MLPLIRHTSSRKHMGDFVNPRWLKFSAIAVALLLIGLNLALLLRLT
jgi:manganese transport protein